MRRAAEKRGRKAPCVDTLGALFRNVCAEVAKPSKGNFVLFNRQLDWLPGVLPQKWVPVYLAGVAYPGG